jgi:hypothetical protein
MADAQKAYGKFKSTQVDTGKVTAGDMFGTREDLKNNYMARMAGAILSHRTRPRARVSVH